jgi:hypothetical protein
MDQYLLPPNLLLWHKYYLEPKAIEKQQMQEDLSALFRLVV